MKRMFGYWPHQAKKLTKGEKEKRSNKKKKKREKKKEKEMKSLGRVLGHWCVKNKKKQIRFTIKG